MKVHNKKKTYIKKYVTRSISSTITVLNSWTRVENRLISGLQYVLLLRMSCFLRSNHHGCHQATAFSSAKAPAGCSDKNSSNQNIESAGGHAMWRGRSLSSTLSPSYRSPRFQFFSFPRFNTTQRGFCQKQRLQSTIHKEKKQCIPGVARDAWRVVRGASLGQFSIAISLNVYNLISIQFYCSG